MPAILSVRAIKRKVRSVGNIKKITRAMQMVSAAKLKKVQVRLMELRPYSDKIREFLQGLAGQVKDLNYPLFQPREKVKKIGVVVVMADKGLCGEYDACTRRLKTLCQLSPDFLPTVCMTAKRRIQLQEHYPVRTPIELRLLRRFHHRSVILLIIH